MMWIVFSLAFWVVAWAVNTRLAGRVQGGGLIVPAIFGLTLLVLWEGMVRGLNISAVILPPPTAIAARFAAELPTLWADFNQTFIKGALRGYVLGCGAAILTAIAIDRSPFLQRGLLPVGNFVAALPIVGIAPILVMWFGFDWQSKAAVVVVMVFFPVLVNTGAGCGRPTRCSAI
jgi:NitT/TauT family transport system permease protein